MEVIPMPRASRIFIENACYHIITRGNQKQAVFYLVKQPEDYIWSSYWWRVLGDKNTLLYMLQF
jgi:hypothetical protein